MYAHTCAWKQSTLARLKAVEKLSLRYPIQRTNCNYSLSALAHTALAD